MFLHQAGIFCIFSDGFSDRVIVSAYHGNGLSISKMSDFVML